MRVYSLADDLLAPLRRYRVVPRRPLTSLPYGAGPTPPGRESEMRRLVPLGSGDLSRCRGARVSLTCCLDGR